MTWVKIDDQLHSHPKIVRAWVSCPASIGLHLLALSHCAHYLTDGQVSETWPRSQGLSPVMRRRAIEALVEAVVWEPAEGGGWLIHDYLDYNESRQEVLAKRAELSEERSRAGRKGAARRWQKGWQTDGKRDGKPMAPVPDPDPVKASSSHPSIEGAPA